MDEEKLKANRELADKYREFIVLLPGYMYHGWDDKEITLYIRPEKAALAKKFVSDNLEGIPVKIHPRNNPPSF